MKTQFHSTDAAYTSRPLITVPVVELPVPRTTAIPTTPDECWLPARGPRRVTEKGFGLDQLAEMQKIIEAEQSDLFDVLAHVAYPHTLPHCGDG